MKQKRKKIKTRLVSLLFDMLGEGWGIDENDFIVNRGSNRYNDWCSWTGCVWQGRTRYDVCSWDTMTALVNHGKLAVVSDDANKLKQLGVNELTKG